MESETITLMLPPHGGGEQIITYGEFDPSVVQELRERRGDAVLQGRFSGKNIVSLGPFERFNLAQLMRDQGKILATLQQAAGQGHEFRVVFFNCSFRPADGCAFQSATLEVTLSNEPRGQPVVVDMHPKSAYDPITRREGSKLAPALKLQASEHLAVEFSLGERTWEDEFVRHAPRIETFKEQGRTKAVWKFSATAAHSLSGAQTLVLLVRQPELQQLYGRFDLVAKVNVDQVDLGVFKDVRLWPFMQQKLGRNDEPLLEELHAL